MKSYCFLAILLMSGSLYLIADNWPRFRGNNGDGKADFNIPTMWNESSYRWSLKLDEPGHGSPAVWGNQVFLNSSANQGKTRKVMAINATMSSLIGRI